MEGELFPFQKFGRLRVNILSTILEKELYKAPLNYNNSTTANITSVMISNSALIIVLYMPVKHK